MTTPVTGAPASEASEMAQQQQATRDTARKIASMIVDGMQGGETATPAAKPAQPNLPTPEKIAQAAAETAAGQTTQATPTPAAEAAGQVAEAAEAEATTEINVDELNRIVEEAALDLGYAPQDVPAELLPTFQKLVENAVQIRQQAEAERLEAAESVEQVREFARQLQETPERLLLTLAVSKPEIFTQVIETFNEMQTNPRVKDMVIRELQSEARLREAERRERAIRDQGYREKAQRVINATKLASRKHSIPFELAEQHVAAMITTNQGKLEASEVDGIVAGLAKTIRGKTVRAPTTRVATPAKVAATNAAPTAEVGSAAAPPAKAGEQSKASSGLTETSPHDRLKKIITGAFGRLSGTERQ